MYTEKEVAEWMVEQFNSTKWLYQSQIVYKIKSIFGEEFVYLNKSRNWSISKGVLKHFRKLTEGEALWIQSRQVWRHRREGEVYKGRKVKF